MLALGCRPETDGPGPLLTASSAPAASSQPLVPLPSASDAAPAPPPEPAPSAAASTNPPGWDPGHGEPQRVAIRVTAEGFVPKEVHLQQGRPGFLLFTREVESECLNAVRMPWMAKAAPLPLRETVTIQIPDMSQPGEFSYACWMDMVYGTVVIDSAPDADTP